MSADEPATLAPRTPRLPVLKTVVVGSMTRLKLRSSVCVQVPAACEVSGHDAPVALTDPKLAGYSLGSVIRPPSVQACHSALRPAPAPDFVVIRITPLAASVPYMVE